MEIQNAGGKLTATFASICGIIVLAFPISMIVEKFADAQEEVAASLQAKHDAISDRRTFKNRKQSVSIRTANRGK